MIPAGRGGAVEYGRQEWSPANSHDCSLSPPYLPIDMSTLDGLNYCIASSWQSSEQGIAQLYKEVEREESSRPGRPKAPMLPPGAVARRDGALRPALDEETPRSPAGPREYVLVADLGDVHFGLEFEGRPPERIVVCGVDFSSWAAHRGVEVGDELLSLNGRTPAATSAQDFGMLMRRIRPLRLRFRRSGGDDPTPAGSPKEVAAGPLRYEVAEAAATCRIGRRRPATARRSFSRGTVLGPAATPPPPQAGRPARPLTPARRISQPSPAPAPAVLLAVRPAGTLRPRWAQPRPASARRAREPESMLDGSVTARAQMELHTARAEVWRLRRELLAAHGLPAKPGAERLVRCSGQGRLPSGDAEGRRGEDGRQADAGPLPEVAATPLQDPARPERGDAARRCDGAMSPLRAPVCPELSPSRRGAPQAEAR